MKADVRTKQRTHIPTTALTLKVGKSYHPHSVFRLNLHLLVYKKAATPGGREVWGVGLLPLVCWGCRFESRRRHGYLSLVSVVTLLGTDLSDGPIPCTEEFYQVRVCVTECDQV